MMIVTDIIKCERLTRKKKSAVTFHLINNAIEFVALRTLDRTETKRFEPNRNVPKFSLRWNSGRHILRNSIRFS